MKKLHLLLLSGVFSILSLASCRENDDALQKQQEQNSKTVSGEEPVYRDYSQIRSLSATASSPETEYLGRSFNRIKFAGNDSRGFTSAIEDVVEKAY